MDLLCFIVKSCFNTVMFVYQETCPLTVNTACIVFGLVLTTVVFICCLQYKLVVLSLKMHNIQL